MCTYELKNNKHSFSKICWTTECESELRALSYRHLQEEPLNGDQCYQCYLNDAEMGRKGDGRISCGLWWRWEKKERQNSSRVEYTASSRVPRRALLPRSPREVWEGMGERRQILPKYQGYNLAVAWSPVAIKKYSGPLKVEVWSPEGQLRFEKYEKNNNKSKHRHA